MFSMRSGFKIYKKNYGFTPLLTFLCNAPETFICVFPLSHHSIACTSLNQLEGGFPPTSSFMVILYFSNKVVCLFLPFVFCFVLFSTFVICFVLFLPFVFMSAETRRGGVQPGFCFCFCFCFCLCFSFSVMKMIFQRISFN